MSMPPISAAEDVAAAAVAVPEAVDIDIVIFAILVPDMDIFPV